MRLMRLMRLAEAHLAPSGRQGGKRAATSAPAQRSRWVTGVNFFGDEHFGCAAVAAEPSTVRRRKGPCMTTVLSNRGVTATAGFLVTVFVGTSIPVLIHLAPFAVDDGAGWPFDVLITPAGSGPRLWSGLSSCPAGCGSESVTQSAAFSAARSWVPTSSSVVSGSLS